MAGKAKKVYPVFVEGDCRVSQVFINAFVNFGGIRRECDACERTHFYLPRTIDMDETEQLQLSHNAAKDPDGYISYTDDADIRGFVFLGKEIIIGCPCHYDVMLEQQLWNNLPEICEYFAFRALAEKRSADKSLDTVQHAQAVIDSKR
jgi:hypothetical protein